LDIQFINEGAQAPFLLSGFYISHHTIFIFSCYGCTLIKSNNTDT
jgi:hypothetical protein